MKAVSLIGLLLIATVSQAATSPGSSQDYKQVQQVMKQLAADHPNNASVFELGTNDQGVKLLGLKLGNGAVKNLIVGTHHGNEYGSTEVALGAAADLAVNPIQGRTIYLIPVLNVSGFETNTRNETNAGGSSVDANRDYPGPCGTEGPYRLKSTHALADFIDREGIVSSATLHTSGGLILYPWGISTSDLSTPYDPMFIDLGRMCAVASQYQVGNSTQLLYPADGAFEDYAFWKHGIWSILFEIGETHSPDPTQVAQIVRENVPGLRKFMEEAPVSRAIDHDFKGRCETKRSRRDRHDE
jgi:carboxypeptidase T